MTSRLSVLSETIAKVSWDPETRKITEVAFFGKDFRFRCKRCAVFCCKLGGPRMRKGDVQRLRQAGREPVDFLDVVDDGSVELEGGGEHVMKQREDGSCVFLEYDSQTKVYRCSIYEFRPVLCRLYPFEFERTGVNTALLRVIPCCNGLSARECASMDREIIDELFGAILDLL